MPLPICLIIQFILNPAEVHHDLIELLVNAVELLVTKLKFRLKDGETIAELRPHTNDGEYASNDCEQRVHAEVHIHYVASASRVMVAVSSTVDVPVRRI